MRQRYLLSLIFVLCMSPLVAQVGQVEFGKNRVQYHNFFEEWQQYESENFITYWYGRSRNIAQSVVQMAEYDFMEIQNLLEHRINEKVQIIVYTDLSDVKQSNIGSEEVFTNTGGQTKIVGNTVFVYFNGNHNHLRKQIRQGVAQVYLNAMLFGSNIQEIVQNAVMLNLPEWFKEGLIGFIGENWNSELDNQLKDLVLSDDFKNFDRFSEEYPKLAGQAFWYYISENYGRSTVSNLLYLTRINRSIESGFLYVLGNSYETVAAGWERYFKSRYTNDLRNRQDAPNNPIEVKNRKELPITTLKLSPDGTKLVYVLNNIGKFKVYLHDLSNGDRKKLLKEGFKNAFQTTDYNYPLIAWNPNGMQLSILYERRDKIYLLNQDIYTGKTEEVLIPDQYQRIYSMDYLNPFTLLFSAQVMGQTDLLTFNPRTRQSERITNDFYDDLDATAVNIGGQQGILFVSNREDTLLQNLTLDTILPIRPFDVFYYNLEDGINEFVRVTNTPLANEREPIAIDTTYFSYLSDRQGIYNRESAYLEDFIHHYEKKIYLNDGTDIVLHIDSTLETLDTSLIDSVITYPVIRQRAVNYINTNYSHNIWFQDKAANNPRIAEAVRKDNNYFIHVHDFSVEQRQSPTLTVFQKNRTALIKEVKEAIEQEMQDTLQSPTGNPEGISKVITIGDAPKENQKKNNLDNFFQSEFGNPEKTAAEIEQAEEPVLPEDISLLPPISTFDFASTDLTENKVHKFRPSNIIPYRLQFRTDYFSTQMDNNLLFNGLDNFAANPDGVFGYPPPGILLKANVKDLFEDHVFEGGIRIPTTFNGAEYFVTYQNRKRRLDKQFAVYMKRQRLNEGSIGLVPQRKENIILLGQFGVRYPLDIFQSVRAFATLRQDRLLQLVTDRASANTETISAQRAGIRLEYVFDNTLERMLNIRNGTRVKVYGEIFKKFNFSTDNGVDLNFSDGSLGILAVDARHYQPILKHSVFATRFAASTTFGSERILYFLGGTDNWFFPATNDDIPKPAGNFAFQAMAANLRGFRIGIRNGNSYALVNSELRIPLFRYFSKRINSSLLKNFQLVGFFDVGTAWEGFTPYRDDNPLNTTVFEEGDVIDVTVNYFRDPIVAGYGVGARTMLFGYFIRVDYGWGVETRVIQDPRLFISLGLDF